MGMPSLSRRRFVELGLAAAGVGLAAGCSLPSVLSGSPKVARVGFLEFAAPGGSSYPAFVDGLRELGYVEHQNLELEYRSANGQLEQVADVASELATHRPDVILVTHRDALATIRQISDTIPIVYPAFQDPVESGLVASLSRPGGNLTGVAITAGLEAAKRLELLKEAVPSLSYVAILWDRFTATRSRETIAAAQALSLRYLALEFEESGDLEALLASGLNAGVNGLVVMGSVRFSAVAQRIVDFAASHRLPAMYSIITSAPLGGLLAYAPNILENYRRAATYVDKILKGARPGDLPIELPSKFDFVVNLKTAQALGLTIPQSTLRQATNVIQ